MGRSWIFVGLAVRHATALALHLRNEAKSLPDVEKELRIRIWWSLYNLERFVAEFSGRPTCVWNKDVSTPFPLNEYEEQFERTRPLYEKRSVSDQSRGSLQISSAGRAYSKTFLAPQPNPLTNLQSRSISQSSSSSSSPFPSQFAKLSMTTSTYFICLTHLS